MPNSKAIAAALVKRHGTRDPFRIARELGFIVVLSPLVEMRGFQQHAKMRRLIYINSDLDERQQRLVCAHELGHHLIHRGMNRIFMDRNTEVVTQKFENQANLFSVELLFSDEELLPFLELPLEYTARYMGVTEQLALWRMNTINPRLTGRAHK